MTTDIILLIVGFLLMIAGLAGSVLPALPGPPLSLIGLLCMHFTSQEEYSWWFIAIWVIIVVVVGVLDYVIPAWGTKKFGGTKWGMWGATAGLIIGGFIIPPIGLILGTLGGAFVGELMNDSSDTKKAMKAALGSLAGFIVGTGIKLAVCVVMFGYFIVGLFKFSFNI